MSLLLLFNTPPERAAGEAELRVLVGVLLEEFRDWRQQQTATPQGMGHNGPPADAVLTADDLTSAETAVTAIAVELDAAKPNTSLMRQMAGILSALAERVRRRIGQVPGLAFAGAVTGAASFATQELLRHPERFADQLERVAKLVDGLF